MLLTISVAFFGRFQLQPLAQGGSGSGSWLRADPAPGSGFRSRCKNEIYNYGNSVNTPKSKFSVLILHIVD